MNNTPIKKMINAILLVLSMLTAFAANARGQDILKYETGVTAKTIPVFAVDSEGKPVYDLDKKDIELYVNGKTVPFEFLKYQFDQQVEAIKKLHPQKDRRVIFIVLDSMFNSETGFQRAGEIVREFVQKRFKGNRFVLLENSAWGGLRYLVGPETDETKIITAMKQLKWFPEKKRKLLFMKPTDHFMPLLISWYMDVAYSTPGTSPLGGFDPDWEKKKIYMENKRFRQKAEVFGQALAQFKYVLQAIDDPKLVFLISEGFSKEKGVTAFKRKYDVKSMSLKGAFREFSLYYLSRIISGINASGSVLYTINPQLTDPAKVEIMADGGALSMKYAAEAGGGKFFEGETVENIVGEIKQYTAAYYELGFSLTPEMGERQSIQLKCNRNGIKLHTVRQSERAKPYQAMNKLEKKLFAYNAAFGGTWSRVTGKVARAVFKTYENEENNTRTLDVEIPGNMKNKKLDIFLLQFDPNTQDLVVDLERRDVKDREQIQFKAQENKVHYFVMIEPSQTICIYGSEKNDDTYKNPDDYSANTASTITAATGSFHLFFDRFKVDEEFQRSRVMFPFKRMRFDPATGRLSNTEEVSKEEWEFTMFENSPDYSWSEPQIEENEAKVILSGEQVRVAVLFKRIDGKWVLTHSEDRSVYK